jgi:hypothetical protein
LVPLEFVYGTLNVAFSMRSMMLRAMALDRTMRAFAHHAPAPHPIAFKR